MIDRKHINIVALISFLLLIGQFAMLSHSVEHQFHVHDQSCRIFLQCEKSGSGLISPELQFFIIASYTQPIQQIVTTWLFLPQFAYCARAPPSLL
jgi:hypothetical protein